MDIITRKDALSQGLTKYYTAQPCKYGHLSHRYVNDHRCVECKRESSTYNPDKYKENKLQILKYQQEYYNKNKTKKLEYQREYYINNKENKLIYQKEYGKNNRERIVEYKRKYYADPDNKSKTNLYKRKYKSNNRATLDGASHEEILQINEMYAACSVLNRCGISVHVDHILPTALGGPHRLWNLEIVSVLYNLTKGKSLEPFLDRFEVRTQDDT